MKFRMRRRLSDRTRPVACLYNNIWNLWSNGRYGFDTWRTRPMSGAYIAKFVYDLTYSMAACCIWCGLISKAYAQCPPRCYHPLPPSGPSPQTQTIFDPPPLIDIPDLSGPITIPRDDPPHIEVRPDPPALSVTPSDHWGALALNTTSSGSPGYGYSYNYSSNQAAAQSALQRCPGACRIVTQFRGCIALASDDSGAWGWSEGSSAAQARRRALTRCEEHSTDCEVRFAICNSD